MQSSDSPFHNTRGVQRLVQQSARPSSVGWEEKRWSFRCCRPDTVFTVQRSEINSTSCPIVIRVGNRSTLKSRACVSHFCPFHDLAPGKCQTKWAIICFQDILISWYFDETFISGSFQLKSQQETIFMFICCKNNSHTLDLEKFWAAGLLDGCETFRYLISCVRCSIFQISIAPIDRMTWQLYSWNGKHDDHCKLRALMGGYWLKLWRHMSELAQRQGWWHLSDWMRLLWNWRKWQTSFTFKLGWHWLWSEVAILMMLYGKLTFQNIWTT